MRRRTWIGIAVFFAAMGIVIPTIVIGDNRAPATGGGGNAAPAAGAPATAGGGGGGKSTKEASGGKATGGGDDALAQGKTLFTQSCGSCHTLKDAGTAGQVGPVLDTIKPNTQRTLNAIKKGGLGSGTMPANLYTGKDAQAVAKYVSSVAGK